MSDEPKSGPQVATPALLAGYYLCLSLAFILNPRLAWQLLSQSWRQLREVLRRRGETSELVPVAMCWPGEGRWMVHRGGLDKEHSHSWTTLGQRFAMDLVGVVESDHSRSEADRLKRFPAFGRTVLSPVAATVVAARDGCRDARLPGTGLFDWRTPDLRGNHVVLDIGEGRSCLLAHLKQHSVRVRPGQRVEPGQVLGECGNSGVSTEPHIHIHAQVGQDTLAGFGLPLEFTNVEIERPGETPGETDGGISTGAVVRVSEIPREARKQRVASPVGLEELWTALLGFGALLLALVLVLRAVVRVLLSQFG